jgi:hypothetical protein
MRQKNAKAMEKKKQEEEAALAALREAKAKK